MVFVGCSGFPVPVSRYWGDFPAVEIADTERGMPGEGSVRRWLRESPEGFAFSVLAPKQIAESGFRRTNANKQAAEAVAQLAKKLKAQAIVFAAPPEYGPTKASRTAVKSFVGALPKGLPQVVLDLPGWKPEQVASLSPSRPITVAYDPLSDSPPPARQLVYLRLPGPAGYRSRYDDTALERVAEHCRSLDAKTVFCIFRNIDMHANGKRLLELID